MFFASVDSFGHCNAVTIYHHMLSVSAFSVAFHFIFQDIINLAGRKQSKQLLISKMNKISYISREFYRKINIILCKTHFRFMNKSSFVVWSEFKIRIPFS